jgi:hypothetical protein
MDGTGDAVHVVVAVHADAALRLNGPDDPLGGLADAGQGERGVERPQRGVEEPAGGGRVAHPAVEEQLGDHRRHPGGPASRPVACGSVASRCHCFSARATGLVLSVMLLASDALSE